MAEFGHIMQSQARDLLNQMLTIDLHFLSVKHLVFLLVHLHYIVIRRVFRQKQPHFHISWEDLLLTDHIYVFCLAFKYLLSLGRAAAV